MKYKEHVYIPWLSVHFIAAAELASSPTRVVAGEIVVVSSTTSVVERVTLFIHEAVSYYVSAASFAVSINFRFLLAV